VLFWDKNLIYRILDIRIYKLMLRFILTKRITIVNSDFLIFFFYISTQGNGEGEFELVTSTSRDVIHSQLSYPLGT
jgi:hypothetical protein